jgi:hypothetical protein
MDKEGVLKSTRVLTYEVRALKTVAFLLPSGHFLNHFCFELIKRV